MAKRSETISGLADQSADQAMYAANFGANWFREVAEQGLNQSRAVLDGYLSISKKAVESVDRQATDISNRSMLIAEETLPARPAFQEAFALEDFRRERPVLWSRAVRYNPEVVSGLSPRG